MLKKWKESDFVKKMKQVRVNRAVYISAVIILLSLSIVLAITVATNRSKKNGADLPADPPRQEQTPTPDGGEQTPTPDDGGSEPTVGNIPELALPVSGTLSKKHAVETQVFSPTMGDYRIHRGIDIETTANAPVYAVASGKISQIWEDPMMGYCVAITHTGDCVTVYKNLSKDVAEGITVGAEVTVGQLIGQVGDSAMLEIAEEPHLHMEMTVKGAQVDPLEYFSATVLETLTENSIYENEAAK